MRNELFNTDAMLNGMMGLITGDALGCPVQFMSRSEIRNRPKGPVSDMEEFGTYHMPKGTWTDDSSMALAALTSIREKDGIDPEDIMERFMNWEFDGEYTPYGEAFDQGLTCVEAIFRYARGENATSCGRTGEHANGNGALMRILPVCLYYVEQVRQGKCTDADAVQGIHAVASLTHNHLRSNIACGLYYFMVKVLAESSGQYEIDQKKKMSEDADLKTLEVVNAAEFSTGKSLVDLLQKGLDEGFAFYEKDVANLTQLAFYERTRNLASFSETLEKEIVSSGYVVASFEAALWCLVTTASFKDCLLKAVNLGDDTDTVAAIAGGLAGLFYGYEAFPKDWLKVIAKREWIEELCGA